MAIYKLVAERRDRNQSMKRKKYNKGLVFFKKSLDDKSSDIEYRSPLKRHSKKITVSEQPPINDLKNLPTEQQRRSIQSYETDLSLTKMNKNLKCLNNKFDTLNITMARKMDDLSKELISLKLKNQ